jgi:hypothetical protein
MLHIVQIFSIMLLAHALEFPGKSRLNREAYMMLQPIYFPGFTVGVELSLTGCRGCNSRIGGKE